MPENKDHQQNSKNDIGTKIRFLGNMLTKQNSATQHIDNQMNILIGIASAVFIYTVPKIENKESIVYLILGFFSAVTVLIGLLSIHPPKFLRLKNKIETIKSIMGNKRISSFNSSQEFSESLEKVMDDEHRIIQHYAATIYNVNINYYRPKRNMHKLAVKIFFAGIAVAILAAIYQHFFA